MASRRWAVDSQEAGSEPAEPGRDRLRHHERAPERAQPVPQPTPAKADETPTTTAP
jgi:hypothetical protein